MNTFTTSLRSTLRPSLLAAACLMGASLAFAPQIHAQPGGAQMSQGEGKAGCRAKHQASAEQRHEKRLQRMTETLNLTGEQQAKLKTLMTERHQAMQQQRREYQQQLKTVLTEAQWQAWQAQKQKREQSSPASNSAS
jgi:Spy/CpxP family protein refolding chaperone